ncbi:MAG: phosphotransferase [Planctomycetes bacterium]|nr:phosphotransferase [Planctomycetota bacterium]
MVLTTSLRARAERLLADMPSAEPGDEVILRPVACGVEATLRRDGAAPRVFAATDEGALERHPADDTGLPGASLLTNAAALRALLEPTIGAITATRLVAWRPSRRAVVRIDTAAGHTHWLKLLDERGHRRSKRTFAALGRVLSPMRLAVPKHCFDDHCAHLAANAPGTSLRAMLAAGEAPITAIARGAAALAYTEVGDTLPTIDFARARAQAVDLLTKASAMRSDLAELGAAIGRLPEPEPPARRGFVHGDLHDKQMFVANGETCVIDLEGAGVGDSRFDVANLAEHVRLRELQRRDTDSGLGDVVVARCGLLPDAAATRLFRAVVRARLCGVYALRPRWAALVDRLCTETRTLMEPFA